MDMQGMYDSYTGHEDLKKVISNIESKLSSEKKEVEKLANVKTTFKSIFKSKL